MKKTLKLSIVAVCLIVLGILGMGNASAKTFEEVVKVDDTYMYMLMSDYMSFDVSSLSNFIGEDESKFMQSIIEFDRDDIKKYNVTYDSNDVIIFLCLGDVDSDFYQKKSITVPAKIGGYDVVAVQSAVHIGFENLESITLNEGIKYVGALNFMSRSISTFKLPASLKYFGDYNMSLMNLNTLNIPANLEYFGDQSESQIITITVDKANKNYKVTDGILYTADGTKLVKATKSNKTEQLKISDKVNEIFGGAFYGINTLKSVYIPSAVSNLAEGTFYDCANLREIYLGNKTTLEEFSINNANSITLYSFGDKSYAKAYAEKAGAKVNYVDLTTQELDNGSFSYRLNTDYNIVLIKYIGSNTTSVTIPEKINGIYVADCEDTLFMDDASGSLTKLNINSLINNNTKYFYVENNILFTADKTKLIYYPGNKLAKTYTVSDQVTTIGDYAFTECKNLEVIYIPSHLSAFKLSSFAGCKNDLIITIKPQNVDSSSIKTSSISYNTVKITWNPVMNVQGYKIYRSTSSSGSGAVEIADISGYKNAVYSDKKAELGKTYYYSVAAYKDAKEGTTFISEKSTFVKGASQLNTPSISSVKSSGYNSLKITWNKISGAQGYFVYRSSNGTSGWKQVGKVTSGSTITYTDSSLTCGTKYYYTVRAYRDVSGTTYRSGYVSPGKAGTPIPSTPKISSVKASGYNSLKITWNKISGAQGYIVYRSLNGTSEWKQVKVITSGSTVTYTDSSLTCGKTYYYTVRAYRDVNGTTYKSGYVSPGTAGKPIPATPSVKAAAAGKSSIKISWNKVTGATGYLVYCKSSDGTWKKIATIKSGTTVTYTNTNLAKGSYTYTVKAYRTQNGTNVYSNYNKTGVTCKIN